MMDPRHQRFAKINLAGIRVIRAKTSEDWFHVARLRADGFARVPGFREPPKTWTDELDTSDRAFTLLASGQNHEWIATMRVQDGRKGPLELAKSINLGSLLKPNEHPTAQFSRLSVAKGPDSMSAMFGLFKAGWRWCVRQQVSSILCATPPWARPIYDFMLFRTLGKEGEFVHEFPAPVPHISMLLPVSASIDMWRRAGIPVLGQFVDLHHPDLDFE